MPAQDLYQYLSQFRSRERMLSLVTFQIRRANANASYSLKVVSHLERVA